MAARSIVVVLCLLFASVQPQKLIGNEVCKTADANVEQEIIFVRKFVLQNTQENGRMKEELISLRNIVNNQSKEISQLRITVKNQSENTKQIESLKEELSQLRNTKNNQSKELNHLRNAMKNQSQTIQEVRDKLLEYGSKITDVKSPEDCTDVMKEGQRADGVYTIYPLGSPIDVFCDLTTEGGGWTVLMTRSNFSLNFTRSYAEYRSGFGSADGAYWIGLDTMHSVTTLRNNEVYFQLVLRNGTHRYARYNNFTIGPPSDGYRLTFDINSYTGNAGDGLYGTSIYGRHYNMRFATYDHDADKASGYNCAIGRGGGGWWYNSCGLSTLTSMTTSDFYWKFIELQAATMMIR